jgi:hypothetical protein
MVDAANYRVIEKLRDGGNYIIRAQRRDDNIIDALHLRAGVRSFYLRFLTRKHRLNNFEAAFYLNVDFIRQVALLADLHGEIIGGARYLHLVTGAGRHRLYRWRCLSKQRHRLSDAASFGIHRPRCRYQRPSRAYLAGQSAGAARAR